MGDPECQTILPKLDNDLFDVIENCINETLNSINLTWSDNQSLCIVLCSKGYPDKFSNEIELSNLNKLEVSENKSEYIFHAGTKFIGDKIYSNGGRVLNFVKASRNFKESRDDLIKIIKRLNWRNGFFRKDIGHRVIDK